jgi:hypothetical protein
MQDRLVDRISSISSDRLSGSLLFALSLFVLWQNLAYPIGSLTDPGAGLMPLLLGLAFAVVTALIVLLGGHSARLKDIGWGEAPRAFVILAACGVATSVFEWLGYRLTLAALLVFLLGVVERRPIVAVVLTAGGFSIVSYFVFHNLLDVQLPRSPWDF